MAIGGLGGGLLAGLSGIAQGLAEAQKQREQQQLMQMRQAQLKRYNQEDQASSALFGNILGGLGDVSGGTALTNPMMAGPQPPSPGQASQPYSPPPAGSGMSSGLARGGGGVSYEDALRLATNAGYTGDQIPTAAAIAMAESSGNPNAHNTKGEDSYGLMQLNAAAHGDRVRTFDPQQNMNLSYEISRGGRDFSPWTVYKTGAYKQYLRPGATAGGDQTSPAGPVGAAGPAGASGEVSETGIALPGDGASRQPPPAAQQQPPAMPRLMASAPPPVQQQVQQTAVATASAIPQQVWGKMSLPALAAQIEKANPGMDPVVKMMALEKAQKLLAPTELRQWEMFKQQHQDAIHLEDQKFARETALLAEDRANRRLDRTEGFQEQILDKRFAQQDELQRRREESAPKTGATTMKDDDGTLYTINPNIPNSAKTLDGRPYTPKGATKIGTRGDLPQPEPQTVALLKDMLKSGLNPPSYMARGPQGQANLNAAMAEMGKEGTKGGDLALARGDVRANTNSLSGLTRVYDQTKSFEGLAEKNLDAAVAASETAVPTDFGPFLNRWIMSGQTQFGDEQVPAYTMLVVTSANELARVLSASTGAAAMTDTARREAAEVLSPYFSSGQFKAAAGVAKQEMRRRIQELEHGLGEIRGRLQTPGSATGGAAPAAAPRTIEGQAGGAKPGGTKYSVGQVIDASGKKYRVTGGDLNGDPDIEPVQ